MLKFNYLVNLGVAGVLVVPAATLQSGTAATLEESLERTLIALENLAGIERDVRSGAPAAVAEIVRWTEPPILVGRTPDDPGASDRMLESLRAEVSGLQTELDVARRPRDAQGIAALDVEPPAPRSAATAVTTGLDESMRRQLAETSRFVQRSPLRDAERREPEGATAADPEAKVAFENPGYAADAVLLGRAFYRQERYDKALVVLESKRGEPEGRYWIARCLEKLGRHDEALETYAAVIEMPAAEHFAARAREDVEFLRWRLKFEAKSR